MKKIDVFALIFLFLTFIGYIYLFHKDSLSYSFDDKLINRYLRSQDIEDTKDEIKDRIFLSDSELYISAGYLYANGASPTKYNFQHPPLVKYLYGFSIKLFNNPYFVQFAFGLIYLVLTYILGARLFRNRLIALGGTSLLFFDPVFSGMFSEALLDLGQATLSLSYVLTSIFYPTSFILQGVILGLFASSKFWSTTLFFLAATIAYRYFTKNKKIDIKGILASFLVAFFVLSLTYLKTFIEKGGFFNIFFWQARILRFMLDHNAAGIIGGPVILFLTGYFSDWWRGNLSRIKDWFPLWPVAFFNSLFLTLRSKKIDLNFFVFILPILYLLYISAQVPFSRYFIIVLPYFYLTLAYSIEKISRRLIAR